jgi:hypothetical protein
MREPQSDPAALQVWSCAGIARVQLLQSLRDQEAANSLELQHLSLRVARLRQQHVATCSADHHTTTDYVIRPRRAA